MWIVTQTDARPSFILEYCRKGPGDDHGRRTQQAILAHSSGRRPTAVARSAAGGRPATPMTYAGTDARPFVVVVAGGHGSTHTTPGDRVIAYALASG